MKKIVEFFGIACLSILFILGCNNADEENENISTNTIEELANDSEFVALLEGIITVHNNSSNLSSVIELLNKPTELTDSEKLQLANVLGFDSVESYQEYEQEFWQSWIDIIKRFDLLSEDSEMIGKVFADRLFQAKTETGKALKRSSSYSNKVNECASGDTQCICRVNFNSCVLDRYEPVFGLENFCVRMNDGEVECDPVIAANPPDGLLFGNLLLCLEEYDCCLIGWDSEECAAIFLCC